MAKEIGQLNVKIGLDATGFQNGISNLNREIEMQFSSWYKLGKDLEAAGQKMQGMQADGKCR